MVWHSAGLNCPQQIARVAPNPRPRSDAIVVRFIVLVLKALVLFILFSSSVPITNVVDNDVVVVAAVVVLVTVVAVITISARLP